MSIRDSIQKHVASGALKCLQSSFLGEETARTIFYSAEVEEVVLGKTANERDRIRLSRAKAVLDSFIEFDRITFGMDPRQKHRAAMMAKVDPIDMGVVDFRALDPHPGLRIFGCFSEPDEYIALTWGFREDLNGQFKAEAERCRNEWDRLFPNIDPHQGDHVNDYIKHNVTAV